jgi:hypothetical protein
MYIEIVDALFLACTTNVDGDEAVIAFHLRNTKNGERAFTGLHEELLRIAIGVQLLESANLGIEKAFIKLSGVRRVTGGHFRLHRRSGGRWRRWRTGGGRADDARHFGDIHPTGRALVPRLVGGQNLPFLEVLARFLQRIRPKRLAVPCEMQQHQPMVRGRR